MAEELKINNLRLNVSFLNDSALLSDEEFGRLVRYGLHYVRGDADTASLTGKEAVLAPIIQRYVDEDNGRYISVVEKRKAAANARWMQEDANASKSMQKDAKDANTKTKTNTKSNNNRERNFVPPTLDEVRQYVNYRGSKVNPERFIAFYASKGWKVGNQPMKDWKAAVISWEQRMKDEAVPVNQDTAGQNMGNVFDKALKRVKERIE